MSFELNPTSAQVRMVRRAPHAALLHAALRPVVPLRQLLLHLGPPLVPHRLRRRRRHLRHRGVQRHPRAVAPGRRPAAAELPQPDHGRERAVPDHGPRLAPRPADPARPAALRRLLRLPRRHVRAHQPDPDAAAAGRGASRGLARRPRGGQAVLAAGGPDRRVREALLRRVHDAGRVPRDRAVVPRARRGGHLRARQLDPAGRVHRLLPQPLRAERLRAGRLPRLRGRRGSSGRQPEHARGRPPGLGHGQAPRAPGHGRHGPKEVRRGAAAGAEGAVGVLSRLGTGCDGERAARVCCVFPSQSRALLVRSRPCDPYDGDRGCEILSLKCGEGGGG